MKRIKYGLLILIFAPLLLLAKEEVVMNKNGVLIDRTTNKELALFGVNYCLPSACDYRAAGYIATDRKNMIDQDMAHLKRMGFDAIRLSFWGDWENSDINGNLINNDHLDLLEYLIHVASGHGFRMLFSPIITYNANWPDKTNIKDMPGFSAHNEKAQLILDRQLIDAQCNYMTQILTHKNRYTEKAIKDEELIFAIEIINEPTQHVDKLKETTQYINTMYTAIRNTGCKKVVCYNLSQDFSIAPAIINSKVEGATYAWYPTALNNGYSLPGNLLPYVANYHQIASVDVGKRFKLVYEFDVPDATGSYLYPAMVREYRKGGIQFAAMFAYDMLSTARYNLGWQSHNFNMVYTPRKAVSAMIAARAMKELPRGADYGKFPASNNFGPFMLDDKNDLSCYFTDKYLYHSNSIDTGLKISLATLEHIAGVGTSPVVATNSQGIYFLDRIREGVWRLEVYPDAIEVTDPYLMPNKNKVAHELIARAVDFVLQLPGLTHKVIATNLINNKVSEGQSGKITLTPGVYVLSATPVSSIDPLPEKVNGIGLRVMALPEIHTTPGCFLHQPETEFSTKDALTINCSWIHSDPAKEVSIFLKVNGSYYRKFPMKATKTAYTYQFELTPLQLKELLSDKQYSATSTAALVEYIIVVDTGETQRMYPSGKPGTPWDWDFNAKELSYRTKIVEPKGKLTILDIEQDKEMLRKTRIFKSAVYEQRFLLNPESNKLVYQVLCNDLSPKPEYKYPTDISISHFIQSKIKSRIGSGFKPQFIELTVRDITASTPSLIVGFNQQDAACWGVEVPLTTEWQTIRIPVSGLSPMPMAMLPQDWPGINPYYYPTVQQGASPDWISIEHLFIAMRSSLYHRSPTSPKGFEIENVNLIF